MAKRYGVLPSQLVLKGDTLDLKCAEVAVSYEKFVQDNPGIKTNHGYTQEQLLEMMQRTKQNA